MDTELTKAKEAALAVIREQSTFVLQNASAVTAARSTKWEAALNDIKLALDVIAKLAEIEKSK